MLDASAYASNLPCQHCGKPNAAAQWPLNGDLVPFYYQKDPGRFQVTIRCPHCAKEWYVVWDDHPGRGCEIDAHLKPRPAPPVQPKRDADSDPSPPSPGNALIDGNSFRLADGLEALYAAIDAEGRGVLRCRSLDYMDASAALATWTRDRYGQRSSQYRDVSSSAFLCAGCLWEFPFSFQMSLMDRGSTPKQVIGATPGHEEFGRTGVCPACGADQCLLLYEHFAADQITQEDVEAIAKYWRDAAGDWWEYEKIPAAPCRSCQAEIPRGQGFLSGKDLTCENCINAGLRAEGLVRLRDNPHYYGSAVLRKARKERRRANRNPSERPKADRQLSVDDTLLAAREIIVAAGPEETLYFLKDSPHAGAAPIRRLMHALAWTHRKPLAGVLDAEFLDPIFCYCDVCTAAWLQSPLLAHVASFQARAGETGMLCTKCGQGLCQTCSRAAVGACSCGGSFTTLRQPNGRKRAATPNVAAEEYLDPHHIPAERPSEVDADLHLFFGYDGRVPIGIDGSLPLTPTAPPADHLRWAETLVEAGVWHQAQQQLDLLPEPDRSGARALWLRARLELVKLANYRERSRRGLDNEWSGEHWWGKPKTVRDWLDEATQKDPTFGPAWLLAAQVHAPGRIDSGRDGDVTRAIECARRAHALLGDRADVLFILGWSLRRAGQYAEAADVLAAVPSQSPQAKEAGTEHWLAALEARCEHEPIDVEAHLTLGRWCCRRGFEDQAYRLFTRLHEQCPTRAEGYFGLAKLTFMGYSPPGNDKQGERYDPVKKYNEVHRLCREALRRDPNLGLVHELMGSLFWNLHCSHDAVAFPREDYLPHYRRALELDATCDSALGAIASNHIDKGEVDAAQELFERAVQLDTTSADVYFKLAVIYKGKRMHDKEHWARTRAKELSPHTELSSDYENKILRLCGFEY